MSKFTQSFHLHKRGRFFALEAATAAVACICFPCDFTIFHQNPYPVLLALAGYYCVGKGVRALAEESGWWAAVLAALAGNVLGMLARFLLAGGDVFTPLHIALFLVIANAITFFPTPRKIS